jgi:hypothetical protein
MSRQERCEHRSESRGGRLPRLGDKNADGGGQFQQSAGRDPFLA